MWRGPRGFQKSSTNQSLLPRSLHSRGGTLPSGGFGSYCSKAASWPSCPSSTAQTGERVWPSRVKFQGCLSPSSLPLHPKPRALRPLAALENTHVCQLGCGACPKSPPGSATEILGSGTESRGSLRREVREQLAVRTEGGKNKSGAAEGRGRGAGLCSPRCGPPCGAGAAGADTPLMQQAKRHVPTVADAPQGSLIVILKDSTKSTWQFTRTDRAGLGVADTLTHTRTGVHTML